MISKNQLRILALVVAILGAVVIGTVAHDLLGVSRLRIREEALAGAALVGVLWTAQTLLRVSR